MASKKTEVSVKETKKEVKVDLEGIKKELTDYVDEKIRAELVDNIEKANKKVIREKNIKIISRDLLILILLGICGFLVYTLYNINYFDVDINKNNKNIDSNSLIEEKEENKEKEEVVVEPTLDELKVKYAHLLDNYSISDESAYLEDFYNGKLTSEIKNCFTMDAIDLNSLTVQDDYNVINEYSFADKYKELFNSEYENKNFDYNGNGIRYISILNSYLSTKVLEHSDTFIKREIVNIVVNDDTIDITTVEGMVIDGKLYNPLTKEEVEGYNNDLINYKDALVTITYTFKNGKLESLSK